MFDIPAFAEQALAILNQGGFAAYLVGGCVRDRVRGGVPKDWDIATGAEPAQVKAAFAGHKVIETGLKHGTVTVLIAGQPLEITTFRVDGDYTDNRRPDSVSFTKSLREDLARRDFTMNALAYHPDEGIIDYFGGVEDIRQGVIRCVGDPDQRFREDGLRLLRALRFSAVYAMPIEAKTAAAIHHNRELLRNISAERVQSELTELLCGDGAPDVLAAYADVFAVPLPEILPMIGFQQHTVYHDSDVWGHTLKVLGAIPPEPVLKWAALLHDMGKPSCFHLDEQGVGHFYGHGAKSAAIAKEILERLKFDHISREKILFLVERHAARLEPNMKTVKRWLGRYGQEALLQLIQLYRADCCGRSPAFYGRLDQYDRLEEIVRAVADSEDCFSLKQLAVKGGDIAGLGYQGKEIGDALAFLLNAVIDEKVANDRQKLLDYLRSQAMERGGAACGWGRYDK